MSSAKISHIIQHILQVIKFIILLLYYFANLVEISKYQNFLDNLSKLYCYKITITIIFL